MQMTTRLVMILVLGAVVASCGDVIEDAMDLRIGLFITPETKHQVVIDYRDGSGTNVYEMQIGDELESAIARAVKRVFRYAAVLESHPTSDMMIEQRLDLAVVADVNLGGAGMSYMRHGWKHEIEAERELSAELGIFTPELKPLTTVTASGIGESSLSMVLLNPRKKVFTDTVKAAIDNLEDEIVWKMRTDSHIAGIFMAKPEETKTAK